MSIVESADSTGDTARVALITGATAGMGLEIARQLAAKGLKVVIGARDVERGDSVVTELREGGMSSRSRWTSPIPPASLRPRSGSPARLVGWTC